MRLSLLLFKLLTSLFLACLLALSAFAGDFAQRLGAKLQGWTGNRWAVILVNQGGAPTLREEQLAEKSALAEEAQSHPLFQAVLQAFPGAKILEVRTPEAIAAEAEADALPEVPDEWDPFEED